MSLWDGATWSPLGKGMNGAVNALEFYSEKFIAGGGFTIAGGPTESRIAEWNGMS